MSKNLRQEYLKSWDQAEAHNGDFKDCLLHYLSVNLGMPVLNELEGGPTKYTDGGVVEMGGVVVDESGLNNEKVE